MTSEPVRDPLADHLLTPQNCALIIIDYQPTQIRSIKSMDQDLLVDRVVHLGCELQRDWGRQGTAAGFTQILFGGERPLAGASTEPADNGVRAGR
jgi:hypothetical protein